MLRKILVASCLLATSMATQASLISHYGYERDSSSNIVKGGGLEWLKWDVTKGMSIDSALSTYSSQGWRLASNVEMAALFNLFEFGKFDWSDNELENQYHNSDWQSDESSQHQHFIELFGFTLKQYCTTDVSVVGSCYSPIDPKIWTAASFGDDSNSNKKYNIAFVMDDSQLLNLGQVPPDNALASLSDDVYRVDQNDGASVGVALVRIANAPSASIPLPGSTSLIALGMVVLALRRRGISSR